ncbi:DUF362 domain-containing protein [Candidatus Woesearchaeota archaeon]|nr:DUF362 domain-containing protein [Candidatus Woesearchaeota archaeon]
MDVSIIECSSYEQDEVDNAVGKALAGIGFDIPKGKRILIKPNVLGQHLPEDNVTTHPSVVGALVRMFIKDNEVIIGESSGFYHEGGTNKALEMSGMKVLAERHKASLVNLEQKPVKNMEDKKAAVYKNPHISSAVFDADMVVNVPKLKTHTLMMYTGAVKNLFGTIPGGRKQKLHVLAKTPEQFANILVDIYQNIKPQLNVMDAVVGLEGNGPGSAGTSKKTGLLLASRSAPCLDIVASGIIGYDPLKVYTNRACFERGLIDDINVVGRKPRVPYKKPVNVSRVPAFISRWFVNQAVMHPYAIKEKCVKCGICKGVCPVEAIKLNPYPEIDSKKCINCYCCHENCPHDAMDLKGSDIYNMLKGIKELIFGRR